MPDTHKALETVMDENSIIKYELEDGVKINNRAFTIAITVTKFK